MGKMIKTLLTLGKVVVKSRPCGGMQKKSESNTLIVMGNGPSLRKTIDENSELLRSHDTMAVNFAANTEDFFTLRPRHYVIADPHFFKFPSKDPNVEKLWSNLGKADWEMVLHIPVKAKTPSLAANISIQRFNMTPGEGYDFVCHPLFKTGMAMPRPRNVLIPSLMEGIRMGYDKIYITGADHTWPHTLYVDHSNRVVSIQPHFYDDNREELDSVAQEYAGLHLHDVLGSMVIAFRSYHEIARYAKKRGVEIYNSTPESLIDAFSRKPILDLK